MAGLAAISFLSTMFSTMPAQAQSASPGARAGAITPTTDESGRKIYVNEDDPSAGSRSRASTPARADAPTASPSRLVYWSSTEHRFKPVPTSGAVMRAARSAASEVNSYLDGKAQAHPTLNRSFTQQDIDAAIDAGGRPAPCGSEPGAVGGQGGIEFQSQCGVAQRRHGADAVDAFDRPFAQCFQSF